jgi:hypothetical protein
MYHAGISLKGIVLLELIVNLSTVLLRRGKQNIVMKSSTKTSLVQRVPGTRRKEVRSPPPAQILLIDPIDLLPLAAAKRLTLKELPILQRVARRGAERKIRKIRVTKKRNKRKIRRIRKRKRVSTDLSSWKC